AFGGWTAPSGLDRNLSTVHDLQAEITRASRVTLAAQPLEVHGPQVDRDRTEVEGKSEEDLIQIAGPESSTASRRWLAAHALQVSVATSRSRLALYMLAMNEPRDDASREYRNAIYEAIYRSETARSRGW